MFTKFIFFIFRSVQKDNIQPLSQVDLTDNNNNSQFIMRLFHKVFKGASYSITPAMTNWVTYCTSIYTKSTLVGVYSVIIMQPAKAQDTITHLNNPYCRQVPNLWPGGVKCATIGTRTHNLRITGLTHYQLHHIATSPVRRLARYTRPCL